LRAERRLQGGEEIQSGIAHIERPLRVTEDTPPTGIPSTRAALSLCWTDRESERLPKSPAQASLDARF
jgi:hypothetical protein